MGKERGESKGRSYLSSAICGCASVLLLFALLFAAALLGDGIREIFLHRALTSKLCLGVSALVCGLLAAGRGGCRRLAHAMTGEGVLLFAIVLYAIADRQGDAAHSLWLDAGIMFFGGFAGALLQRNAKKQRRGKRQYAL